MKNKARLSGFFLAAATLLTTLSGCFLAGGLIADDVIDEAEFVNLSSDAGQAIPTGTSSCKVCNQPDITLACQRWIDGRGVVKTPCRLTVGNKTYTVQLGVVKPNPPGTTPPPKPRPAPSPKRFEGSEDWVLACAEYGSEVSCPNK